MTLFCDLRAHVTFGRCAWMALFLVSVAGALAQVTEEPAPVHLPLIDGKDIRFTRLSTTDGLSQTRVAQIVQDDLGFIWLGTQYGLNRFDGYEFKVFVHNPRSPESLSGAFISSLFKDRQGYLWVGCAQTLDRFDPVTETFKHYRVDTDDPEGLSGTVVHISEDRSGMLWLATGTGLYRLDPASGRVLHYLPPRRRPHEPKQRRCQVQRRRQFGNILGRHERRLGRIRSRNREGHASCAVAGTVQISFYEDRLGVFWIAYTSGNGLAVFDRKTRKLTRYSFYEKDPPAGALTGVMGMLEDREGNLWLGSPGAGLLRFDREHQRFIRYRNNPTDPSSLAEDKVIALFEDREGNVWTGLHSMGPNHFSQTPPHFETFQLDPAQPDGLDMNFVNAMLTNGNACLRWLAKVEENSINLTEVRASVGRILRDGKRAGDVIGRIRALFKKAEAAKERLDLNEAIREVIALSRSEMSSHRIVLQLELAPDLVPVIGDRVQLQQVVLNLILNAIEAMIMVEDRPRELVIRTQVHEQTSVLVTVRDTGPGLDPGSLDKVFAAFHTTKPGGLGMGLSISRSIVESHYGRLWGTANERPGAAFHFTLLAHRATDESESES